MNLRFTTHALTEMASRGLERGLVERVIRKPDQIRPERFGREARQSKVDFPDGEYLLRVIVDPRSDPPAVVTAYRTRYIAKYWRQE